MASKIDQNRPLPFQGTRISTQAFRGLLIGSPRGCLARCSEACWRDPQEFPSGAISSTRPAGWCPTT